MNNNKFVNGFKNINNQFVNNNANPLFTTDIYNNNFYRNMNLMREEKLKKVKNIDQLGLSKKEIADYVISPIRVEKEDSNEIIKNIDNERKRLGREYIEKNYWKNRTNAPYKNIMKDLNWKKKFLKKEDLIVHKVSKKDKNKIKLLKELDELNQIIEIHEGDLKVIYSASEKNKHKKKFQYTQKTKYKMKYNPKDFNDLKEHYAREQNLHEKHQRKLSKLIAQLTESEDISESKIKKIEHDIKKLNKKIDNTTNDFDEIDELINSKKEKKNKSKKDKKVKKKEKDEKKVNVSIKEVNKKKNSKTEEKIKVNINIKKNEGKKKEIKNKDDNKKVIKIKVGKIGEK